MAEQPVEGWDWDDPAAIATTPLDEAIVRRDARLLAAAARAGGRLPAASGDVLAGLRDIGLVAVAANNHGRPTVVIGPAADVRLVADGEDVGPLTMRGPRIRRAMLGVLLVCASPNDPHPYPGRSSSVGAIRTLLRIRRGSPSHVHLKGGLRELDAYGLVELGDDEPAGLPDTTTVRLGARVATWNSPWVRDDLPLLLRQVANACQVIS
jgi:hypothetical protein